jgi:hypothetical protein
MSIGGASPKKDATVTPRMVSDAINDWSVKAQENGFFDSDELSGFQNQEGFETYLAGKDTSKMSYKDFATSYAEFRAARDLGKYIGESLLSAVFTIAPGVVPDLALKKNPVAGYGFEPQRHMAGKVLGVREKSSGWALAEVG